MGNSILGGTQATVVFTFTQAIDTILIESIGTSDFITIAQNSCASDTDADTVLNPLDIDDDNDGILDSVEIANAAGAGGDSDSDTFPDHQDIDSDNDGIPDNVEAQPTAAYVAPAGADADGDGLDDNYEGSGDAGLTPVNTDMTDNPDYLDSDSENDGAPDAAENNEVASATLPGDTDGDGLDDNFDDVDNTVTWDVNDDIDDPANNLPDDDSDAGSGGDVDYRDTAISPVAVADTIVTPLNTPVTLAVTANDIDSDGTVDVATVDLDPVTAGQQTSFAVAGQGTFTADGSGNVTFTPTAGFVGTSTIPYTVNDNEGRVSAPANISVTVVSGPAANNDAATTAVNTPVTLNVMANDIAGGSATLAPGTLDLNPSAAGQQATFAVAGQGTFASDGSGHVTFTPDAGFTTGSSMASYTIDNNLGATSNIATITVTIANTPPVATDDTTTTLVNTAVTSMCSPTTTMPMATPSRSTA